MPLINRTITRVCYDLFPDEVASFEDTDEFELDGEVHIYFADAVERFISWSNKPVGYCVAIAEHSFFQPGSLRARDVSATRLWSSLVGQPARFDYLDAELQVLQVSVAATTVYLSTANAGGSHRDIIRVAATPPPPPNFA